MDDKSLHGDQFALLIARARALGARGKLRLLEMAEHGHSVACSLGVDSGEHCESPYRTRTVVTARGRGLDYGGIS